MVGGQAVIIVIALQWILINCQCIASHCKSESWNQIPKCKHFISPIECNRHVCLPLNSLTAKTNILRTSDSLYNQGAVYGQWSFVQNKYVCNVIGGQKIVWRKKQKLSIRNVNICTYCMLWMECNRRMSLNWYYLSLIATMCTESHYWL